MPTLHSISYEDIFRIKSFSMKQTEEDWAKILEHRFNYCLQDSKLSKIDNMFPGFYFSNKDICEFFDNYMINYFLKIKAKTIPRGNITNKNNIIVMGYRPGHTRLYLSRGESAWLLGPSSQMLCKLLYETDVYPYFTNFYHSSHIKMNGNSSHILKELICLFNLYTMFYNIKDFTIVFLGSYKEYEDLKSILLKMGKINLNFIKIWHPAYLTRAYSKQKFEDWKYNFKYSLDKIK